MTEAKPLDSKVVAWMREVLAAAGYSVVRNADIEWLTAQTVISKHTLVRYSDAHSLQAYITDQLAKDLAREAVQASIIARERVEEGEDDTVFKFRQSMRVIRP